MRTYDYESLYVKEVCKNCGYEFDRYKHHPNTQFCSKDCYEDFDSCFKPLTLNFNARPLGERK